MRVSPLYGSKPFGPVPQPDFVNAVAALLTQLDSRALLGELQALESAIGTAAGAASAGGRASSISTCWSSAGSAGRSRS